jgi:hypothetical protein
MNKPGPVVHSPGSSRTVRFRRLCLAAAALLAGCASGERLFDGDSLAGWEQTGDAHWQVRSGLLVAQGEGLGYLLSLEDYENYTLRLDFWIDATTNSGVFIHCEDRADISPQSCYELNIWDEHPQPEARTGAIVMEVMPPLAQVDTVGKWNTYEIIARDGLVHARINGETTALIDGPQRRRGFIALQHGQKGTVKFRSIVLTRF